MSAIDKIKEQRQREIRKGENGFAAHPIYIVYSEGYTYGDPDEPDQSTTRFGTKERFVRIDSDGNEKAAEKNTDRYITQFALPPIPHKPIPRTNSPLPRKLNSHKVPIIVSDKNAIRKALLSMRNNMPRDLF